MIENDTFFFAIHLNNEFPFSNPIAPNYNKLEITNAKPPLWRGLWIFESLLEDKEFKKALAEKPYRNGWFLKLEKKYK